MTTQNSTIEAVEIGRRTYSKPEIAYIWRCACGWSSGFTYNTEELARRFGTLVNSRGIGHHRCES